MQARLQVRSSTKAALHFNRVSRYWTSDGTAAVRKDYEKALHLSCMFDYIERTNLFISRAK